MPCVVGAKRLTHQNAHRLGFEPGGASGVDSDPRKNQRYNEFERFEALFEECLSFNAIEKRFETHTRGGLQMTRDIATMLEQYAQRLGTYRKRVGTFVLSRERERDQLHSRVADVGDQCRDVINSYVVRGLAFCLGSFGAAWVLWCYKGCVVNGGCGQGTGCRASLRVCC